MANVYRSNYDGLQVTLNSRNYHGLSMVAGYTWSHSLDDVGANWDFGYGSGLPQNAYNPGAEYANSDFDVRQRFTLSAHLRHPRQERLRPGVWRDGKFNSIITLQTPQSWGPMDEGTDAAGIGPLPVSPPANTPIRWSFYGNPNDFKSTPTGIPYFGGTIAQPIRAATRPAMPRLWRLMEVLPERRPNRWHSSVAMRKATPSCFRHPWDNSATWAATPFRILDSRT